MSDYYPPNTRVLVVLPGDPFTGQVGTVTATHNDGGDMVHRVEFSAELNGYPSPDGYYLAHELRYARTKPRTKPTPTQRDNGR